MHSGTRKALSGGASEDLARHTLEKLSSIFDRLVFLAGTRDRQSGSYRHDGLAAIHGEVAASRCLKGAHEAVFREWLRLSLEQKVEDLKASVNQEDASNGERHTSNAPQYIPASARSSEIALFTTEMDLLEQLMARTQESQPRERDGAIKNRERGNRGEL